MKANIVLLFLALSLQLFSPQTSAQSIDINSVGVPSIAWRALGFLTKWKDTDNSGAKNAEQSSATFSGTTSWMFLDTGYAFSAEEGNVYKYALSADGKNWSWELLFEGFSSFQPTIVPDIYLYSLSGETRLYVSFYGEVQDTQLCSNFYSFGVMTQTLYGIFEICDLDEGPFLGMLDVTASEIVEIATVPGVANEDLIDISANGSGGCYVVDSAGNAYSYDSAADSWTQILQTTSESNSKKESEPLYVIGVAANTLDGSVWLLTDPSSGNSASGEEKKNQIYLYNPIEDSATKYSSTKNAKKLEATYILAASISDEEGTVLSLDIVIFFFISIGQKINGIISEKLSGVLEGMTG